MFLSFPPYSNFPISYIVWCSLQQKQGILHSGLIKNPTMPYKKLAKPLVIYNKTVNINNYLLRLEVIKS